MRQLPEPVEGGLPEFVKHDKHDDTRAVVSDEHLETMVVAAVATLKDKSGTNQTRMGHWLEAKLVCAVCVCVCVCVCHGVAVLWRCGHRSHAARERGRGVMAGAAGRHGAPAAQLQEGV